MYRGGPVAAADVPESDEPINVLLNDWTGQYVSAKVSGELPKKMGRDIEYVRAGAIPRYAGLAQGNLHFQAEVWSNDVGDIYPEAVESREMVELGEPGIDAWQGWMYPT